MSSGSVLLSVVENGYHLETRIAEAKVKHEGRVEGNRCTHIPQVFVLHKKRQSSQETKLCLGRRLLWYGYHVVGLGKLGPKMAWWELALGYLLSEACCRFCAFERTWL